MLGRLGVDFQQCVERRPPLPGGHLQAGLQQGDGQFGGWVRLSRPVEETISLLSGTEFVGGLGGAQKVDGRRCKVRRRPRQQALRLLPVALLQQQQAVGGPLGGGLTAPVAAP